MTVKEERVVLPVCRFCGGRPRVEVGPGGVWIDCVNPECRPPVFVFAADLEAAVRAWGEVYGFAGDVETRHALSLQSGR